MSSLTKSLLRAAPPRTDRARLDCPQKFLPWLEWMNVQPRPGQAELARVAFDGDQPVDRDLAVAIFGNVDFDNLSMGLRRVVAAVVGGRAGKTYLLIALRLLFGMCVRDLSVLRPGEEAFATVVAQNDKLRQQAINYALGAARSKPELAALLRLPKGTKPGTPVSSFGLHRPDFDRVVTFQGAVASAGGLGVRGVWHTDLALDECAFFRDAGFKINDKDIYEAGVSRVMPGGQCILGSTPWAKAGLLYEFYRDNYEKPTTALVAHATTLLLNDSPETRAVVELETKRDPDNAKREYGAQFMESGTTIFFESSTIDAAVTDEPFEPRPGDVYGAGGDFGFRSDSSALVMVVLRGDTLHVFDGTEERPTEDAPLKPSVTVAAFAAKIAGRCQYLMADAHYREAIAELLDANGLTYAAAPLTPADTYVRARMLMRDGKVKIHPLPFRDRLVQQMREVHGRPTSGGGMSIVHPRWATGGHGDLCAALVLAVWFVCGETVTAPKSELGTKEWEAMAREQRQRAMLERLETPGDRGKGAWWRR
jgi:hypothetical protein